VTVGYGDQGSATKTGHKPCHTTHKGGRPAANDHTPGTTRHQRHAPVSTDHHSDTPGGTNPSGNGPNQGSGTLAQLSSITVSNGLPTTGANLAGLLALAGLGIALGAGVLVATGRWPGRLFSRLARAFSLR
jgi:hypothetical protein